MQMHICIFEKSQLEGLYVEDQLETTFFKPPMSTNTDGAPTKNPVDFRASSMCPRQCVQES